MNKKMMSLLLALALAMLAACGAETDAGVEPVDSIALAEMESANVITEDKLEQVCELLSEAGLSNVDVFKRWVREYASGASAQNQESSGFYDADCRMTVMLLAGDLIQSDSVQEEYSGNYLMFDLDAIDNDPSFSMLAPKRQLFTTMFGEMPISQGGFAAALAERWSEHGLRVESDRCSVISILFKAYGQEDAFVGHTGILIDCRGIEGAGSNFVFVEKIAFAAPFCMTELQDAAELLELFSARPDYMVEEGDPAPVVYRNGVAIGELSRRP